MRPACQIVVSGRVVPGLLQMLGPAAFPAGIGGVRSVEN